MAVDGPNDEDDDDEEYLPIAPPDFEEEISKPINRVRAILVQEEDDVFVEDELAQENNHLVVEKSVLNDAETHLKDILLPLVEILMSFGDVCAVISQEYEFVSEYLQR